jgi:glycosyltransferase involved in cell wall biosynthesis
MPQSRTLTGAPDRSLYVSVDRGPSLEDGRLFDSRWFGDHGIGRFAREVYSRLVGYRAVPFPGLPWKAIDTLTTSWHLLEQQPSFYFTPGYNAPIQCPCPFALTVHDLNHIATPGQSTVLKRFYYRTILKPAIFRAAVILTVSDYSRTSILDWSGVDPSRVVNVSNGISAAFRRDGSAYHGNEKPYLLAIASQKPHKNQEGLLKSYAHSRCRHAVDLLMVGTCDEATTRLLKGAGVRESVKFLGHQSDADLAALYRGATAFLFVSHYEGFGLPIVEAMACGAPVITSSVAAMPEVAGGAAVLVDPASVEEISAAIDQVCHSSELPGELRERGLLRAALFSWDQTGRRVQAALEPFH